MILNFRDDWLRGFYLDNERTRQIPPDLESRVYRRRQLLVAARTDRDLRTPPSNHFEKLRGGLDGWHSVRVNQQWRVIFRWDAERGEASDVYLEDHSYR